MASHPTGPKHDPERGHRKHNPAINEKTAQGFTILQELGVSHLNPKEAHSRFHRSGVQKATGGSSALLIAVDMIRAEKYGAGTVVQDVLPKMFRLGTGGNHNEQDPTGWKKTKSYTPSGELITPSTVHKDVQTFLKNLGGKVEKGLIDWLNIVAWELKPEWTTARFYEALGKAGCVQDEYGYDVGLMGLYPIDEKAMARLRKRGFSYACLNWATRKLDVTNSYFATESARESLKGLIA